MKLSIAADKINRASFEAWIKRLNWIYMDERIQNQFNFQIYDKSSADELGSFYISRAKDEEKIKSQKLFCTQFINSTHIFTGSRFLGLHFFDRDKGKFSVAVERNAQLWYSQSPSGDVLVFVAPYQSDLGEISEKEIIIDRFSNPYDVKDKHIKKHLSIFFKYCSCTSQHATLNMTNYLFRRYLLLKDFRYRSTYRKRLLDVFERLILILLGCAAVWASLYAGGKI